MQKFRIGISSCSLMMKAILAAAVLTMIAAGGKPRIDLNHASVQELQSIPGIGPAYAVRIVHERERRCGFRSVTDLLKVRGIGRKKLARMRPYVTVTPYEGGYRIRPAK
ncbi:helix-hairpin-helix domain-containing protein [bacterium]|nr:helix-hairpin-helix domain-containing protein [candidate division CSSED10-310 bacterium]